MKNLAKIGILVMLVIVANFLPVLHFYATQKSIDDERVYVSHSPIVINNNTDLETEAAAEGWLGSGTASDPYLIEGYEIFGGTNGIYIGNTSLYFVIKDCYIHNNTNDGIYFYNVKYGKIENSTVAGNTGYGVYVNSSLYSNIYIVDTTVLSNELLDIEIYLSTDVYVIGYVAPTVGGMWIENSADITVKGVSFSGEVYVGSSSENIIFQNNTIDGGDFVTGSLGNIVFENNTVNFTGTYGIKLNSTNFIITNNTVIGSGIYAKGDGVVYGNGLNNTVIYVETYQQTDKIVVRNNLAGQIVVGASNITLENNTIKNNGRTGIVVTSLYKLYDINIYNNTIMSDGTYEGIDVVGASQVKIYGNNISDVSKGISVGNVQNIQICKNNITNSTTGMYFYLVSAVEVGMNSISNNSQNGIQLNSTNNVDIYNNTIERNGLYGIYMGDYSAQNTTIHNNFLIKNTNYGIVIYNGTYNIIYNNTFYDNNGATSTYNTLHIQARDDSTGNFWNTSGTPHGYGNYWNDWLSPDANGDGIVDNAYAIDGVAGAKDTYPRTLTFTISTTQEFSPNGDGFNDTCVVNITSPSPYLWYIEVSNASGLVYSYTNHTLVSNLTFIWNGTDNNGTLVYTGEYNITVFVSNGYLNKSATNTTYLDNIIPVVFYKTGLEGGGNNTIINTSSPLFSWTASSDSNAGMWKYVLIVNNTPDCSNPLYSINLSSTTTSYRIYNIPDGTYYWWVLAVDKANNKRFADGGAYWNGTTFITNKWWWKFTIDTVSPQATNFTLAPVPYSPNGDGRHDVLYINLTFSENLYYWSITIYNSSGSPVSGATWTGSGASASVYFNDYVPEGDYRVHVYMEDFAGNSATADKWFTCDLTPLPAPIITQPSNNTYTNNRTVDIIWTAPTNLTNWSHDIVVITYTTNNTIINETVIDNPNFQFNYTFKSDGNYTILIYRYDIAGNENVSAPVFIHVDTEPPTIPVLLSPQNNSYSNLNIVNFTWSYSADASPTTYMLKIYYPGGSLWKEVTTTENYSLVNVSVFTTTQTLFWNLTAMDDAGNYVNSTQTFELIVDHQPPTFTYTIQHRTISPNGDGVDDMAYINCTSTSNGGEPLKWKVEIYSSGGNVVYTIETSNYYINYNFVWNGENTSGTVQPDGNYTVKIYAFDYANNYAVSTSYIIIDLTPPTPPQILSPLNNSYHNATVYFEWKWTDSFASAELFISYINGTLLYSSSLTTNTTNLTLKMNGGNYLFWIVVSDAYANKENSTMIHFTVDMRPPNVNLSINATLKNGTYIYGNKSVNLVINATDDSGVADMRIIAQSKILTVDTGWIKYSYYYEIILNHSGIYNITVFVKDTVGNIANSSILLNLDVSPPEIFDISVKHWIVFTNESNVSVNATDYSGIAKWGYSLNGTVFWFNTSSFVVMLPDKEGNYTITIYVVDVWGNTATEKAWINEVRHRPVGGIAPQVRLTNNDTIAFSFNATDSEFSIAGFWLKIDGGSWKYYNMTGKMSITFIEDGNHTVYAKYVNSIGVESEIYSTWVVVDTAPPSVSVSGVPAYTNATQITIHVSGNDTLSGIAFYKVYVAYNGGAWAFLETLPANTTSCVIMLPNQGEYEISVVGYDRAGNHGAITPQAKVIVDRTAPSLVIDVKNTTLRTTFNFTLEWNATDNTGIAYYLVVIYQEDMRGAWKVINTTSTEVNLVFADNHTYVIYIYAYDDAGNYIRKSVSITENYVYAPEIKKTSIPQNATAGEVDFYAEGYDVKNLTLNYTWIVDNKTVGYGQYLKINLKPGNHTIILVVSNGFKNITKEWNITVAPASTGSGNGGTKAQPSIMDLLLPLILFFILIALLLVVLIVLLKRRKKGEETDEGLSEEELMLLNATKEYLEKHNGEKVENVMKAVSEKLGVEGRDVMMIIDIGESKGIFTKETDSDGNMRIYLVSKNIDVEEKEE